MRRYGGKSEKSGEVVNRPGEEIVLYDHDDVNGIEVLLAAKAPVWTLCFDLPHSAFVW